VSKNDEFTLYCVYRLMMSLSSGMVSSVDVKQYLASLFIVSKGPVS
jgi:hypothetical protein